VAGNTEDRRFRARAGAAQPVGALAPGIFLTPMMEAFPQNVQDALGAQAPHPSRLGRPAEYAQLVIEYGP